MCEDILLSRPGRLKTCVVIKYTVGCTEGPKQAGIEDGAAWSILLYQTISGHPPIPAAPFCVKHIVEPERQDILCETFVGFTA